MYEKHNCGRWNWCIYS